jgi:hypothetical protein
MKNSLLAAAMAALLVVPAHAQSPASPAPQTVVMESTEPVPVPQDARPGSSSPTMGGVAAGVGLGIVIVGVGLVIACGIACAN